MKLWAALALLGGLAACSKAMPPAPRAIPVVAPADVPAIASSVPTPALPVAEAKAFVAREVVAITRRKAISIADVAPAQRASASMPGGSIYVSVVLEGASALAPGTPMIFEWDVAGKRVVAEKALLPRSRDEHVQVLRLASTNDRIYVASECWVPECAVRLTVLNRQLKTIGAATLAVGTAVSIDATEELVAVAVAQHQLERRPLVVALLDATSLKPLATKELAASGGSTAGFVRASALDLVGNRLYVAGRALTASVPRRDDEGHVIGTTSVFAFDLPTFTLRASFESATAAAIEPGLLARGNELLLFAGDDLLALSGDLRPVDARALQGEASGNVAVAMLGPNAELFTGGTTEQRSELFPGSVFPCTAAWSASTPVLVCHSDHGLRIARFRE